MFVANAGKYTSPMDPVGSILDLLGHDADGKSSKHILPSGGLIVIYHGFMVFSWKHKSTWYLKDGPQVRKSRGMDS